MPPVVPQMQRIPPPALTELLQKQPSNPSQEDNAYNKESTTEEKGGLPLEIVAAAQVVYKHMPQPPQKGKSSTELQPGWGGQGT